MEFSKKKGFKMAKYVKRCPKCGSEDIEYMMQERKSFNGCVGCIGWLFYWPLVLLGFVGKKGKHTWHCRNCGRIFKSKK